MAKAAVAIVISVPGVASAWLLGNAPDRGRINDTPFDDLVEFAPIKPYASTHRAIIDFDTLAIRRHLKLCTLNNDFPDIM